MGTHALEFYGPPERLTEVEAIAEGLPTRRTGPSVSILRAESIPEAMHDRLGVGTKRVANLEDVFVLLTGEVLE